MKNLRHLLRRTSLLRSKARRTPANQNSGAKQRRLSTEALEKRQLLAGDVGDFLPAHNYWNRFDVNNDQEITALDALIGINELKASSANAELAPDGSNGMMVDVNADGKHTALDTLQVLNALEGGEQVGELVELQLNARTLADTPLDTNNNGQIDVGTEINLNEAFKLEVTYDDLRGFGDGTGVFKLAVDIGVSTGGNLKPVLRETHRVIIGEEIRTASSGELTLQLDGVAGTESITFQQIANTNAPQDLFIDALVNLGYDRANLAGSNFEIGEGDDIGIEIRYTDPAVGNQNLPNMILTSNFDVAVPLTFQEFAPFEADGVTPNGAAVRFNIDTLSRTFKNNEPFYNTLNRGDFDLTTGFDETGGVGGVPTGGGGIPELVGPGNSFIEPFDAFSLEVMLTQAIDVNTPFTVNVNPGESNENMLLYGNNDPVPPDMILIDDDAVVTFVQDVVNGAPDVSAGPVTATFAETDAQGMVDLLTGATDPENDTLSVVGVALAPGNTGDATGLTFSATNNIVTVDPSAYASLNTGESEVITFAYQVTDGTTPVNQTATITITGVTQNTAPVVSGPVLATFAETDQPAAVNLLANATDADGDTLSISGVSVTSGDASGITVDLANNRLDVTPQSYGSLTNGQSEVVVYSYTVSDGNGGNTAASATVTINGVDDGNQAPVVDPATISASVNEDDVNSSIDLLQNATDAENDTLSLVNAALVSGDSSGVTVDTVNGELDITPGSYNSLSVGQTEQIVYTYNVSDGNSNSNQATVTVTVSGANDQPSVAAAISQTFGEDDAVANIDALTGASDPDAGDTLSVDSNSISISGDTSNGVSLNNDLITVNPSAYNGLNTGQSAVITVNYNIVDGNGGSVAQTATITINGDDDVVNQNPVVSDSIAVTSNEDAANFSVDLLTNASDPDGDTLNVSGLSLSGDTSGVVQSGNSLSVTPSAYGSLNQGQSAVITATYTIVDGNGGSVGQTATITIEGRDEDPGNRAPVVSAPVTASFDEDDATANVSLLTNASDPDGDTLSAVNASVSNDPNNAVTVSGNTISVNPSAYNALNTGQSQIITVSYQVSDGALSTSQTATITIVGENDGAVPGSTISGDLFIDAINNIHQLPEGEAPFRDGIRGSNDLGLAGIPVHLRPINGTSGSPLTVLSDAEGHYEFTNVAPGTYEVEYELPNSVMVSGSTSSTVVIGAAGGESASGGNVASHGLTGVMSNLDILALPYLRAGIINSSLMTDDGVLQGGSVQLTESGVQQLVVLGEGYDGIRFAEFTLNDARDAALLTIVESDGTVKTARLDDTKFVVSGDGTGVKFFGGMEDHNFVTDVDDLVESEFANYRNAIDQVLGAIGS